MQTGKRQSVSGNKPPTKPGATSDETASGDSKDGWTECIKGGKVGRKRGMNGKMTKGYWA